MTVCDSCGQLTMDSITVCNDCRRERDEFREINKCDNCERYVCLCDDFEEEETV